MILPNLKAIGIASIAGLLIGSLGTWYLTAEYKDALWGASVNQQKVEAAGLLADEVEKVVKRERTAQIRVRELELEHESTTDHLEALERTNRTLAAQHGGVRDTGRRANSAHPVPPTATQAAGAANPAQCDTRVLSAELTEELITKAALADRYLEYAWQGYQWSLEVDAMTHPEVKD